MRVRRGRNGRSPARILTACAGLLALGLATSGCSAIAEAYDGTANILRIGTDGGIDSLNPFVAQSADSYSTFLEIYPYLVQYGRRLQIIPDFARSWTLSSNGRVWTFHTVRGATWSDGRPLTAEDAAWTLTIMMRFQNGATASGASVIAHMKSAVATSPDTLVITYDRPVANVLSQLQQIPILPRHIWRRYAAGNGLGLKTFSNPAPIVSGGPFQLVKYTAKEIALFRRNPRWWGPRPHIDGFGLETFNDDDSLVEELITHRLDAIETVPPTAVAIVRRDGFDIDAAPGLALNYFSINDNPHMLGHRELLNPLVREAFNVAINRSEIDKVAYLGEAQPAGNVIVPADGSWYDPALRPPPYDPELADHLLDEAGYKMGPGHVRLVDGHPMSYQMVLYPTGGPETRIFQIISQNFQRIGVRVSGITEDTAAATLAVYGPKNNYPSFQLQFSEWEPEVDPDFQLSVFLKSQWGGWNDSGFDDPTYDRLYSEQGTTMNPAARRAVVWRMERLLEAKLPYVVVDYPEWVAAHASNWHGFVMTGQGFFNGLSDLTLLSVHHT